jgi:polysaccharide biosynthesis protein PslA
MKATKILTSDMSASRTVATDTCLILTACYLAVKISGSEHSSNLFPEIVTTAAAGLFLLAVMFSVLRVYADDRRRDLTFQLLRIFLGWTGSFVALLTVSAVLPFVPYASPHWVLLWYVIGLGSIFSYRILLFTRFRNLHRSNVRNIVLAGGGSALANLLWVIESGYFLGRNERVLGVFVDPDDIPLHMPPQISVLGNLLDLSIYLRNSPIDGVIVTFPRERSEDMLLIIREMDAFQVNIQVVTDEYSHKNSAQTGELAAISSGRVFSREQPHWWDYRLRIKRTIDIALASAALMLLSPIMAAAIVAIKIESPGPILFKQQRFGYNNVVFRIWKFRSMYIDHGDPAGATRTVRNDPRVTRMGYWLRRTSVDELPQLCNILRGEMSCVGPRAHPVAMRVCGKPYGEVVDNYADRHQIWPGMTGLAQVNGLRGEVDCIEKAKLRTGYDLKYIENWSLMLDMKIMVQTIFILFRDKNAY